MQKFGGGVARCLAQGVFRYHEAFHSAAPPRPPLRALAAAPRSNNPHTFMTQQSGQAVQSVQLPDPNARVPRCTHQHRHTGVRLRRGGSGHTSRHPGSPSSAKNTTLHMETRHRPGTDSLWAISCGPITVTHPLPLSLLHTHCHRHCHTPTATVTVTHPPPPSLSHTHCHRRCHTPTATVAVTHPPPPSLSHTHCHRRRHTPTATVTVTHPLPPSLSHTHCHCHCYTPTATVTVTHPPPPSLSHTHRHRHCHTPIATVAVTLTVTATLNAKL